MLSSRRNRNERARWAVKNIFKKGKVMSSSNSGIVFTGLLTIVFIVLKLTGYISWSWWWVLSPVWIPLAISIVLVILYAFAKSYDL
jgi:hypothetical protein